MKVYDLYEKATTAIFCLIGIALVSVQLLPDHSKKFQSQIYDTGVLQSMNTYFSSFKENSRKNVLPLNSNQRKVLYASSANNNLNLIIAINQDSIPPQKRGSRSVIHSVANGKEVEVTHIDGEVTKLKINGKRISPENFEKYTDLVESVVRESGPGLPKPAYKYSEPRAERSDKAFQEKLIRNLLGDKLITNKNKFSFSITKNKLTVNGKKASEDLLEKYLKIMVDHKGEHITSGTSYEIEKY